MRRMYSENQIKKIIEESPATVVEALKGQDISIEGLTSKGIANTGGLANIGNVAFSGGDFTSSSAKIFENIKDSQGHNRFVEGEGNMQTRDGITPVYVKWSLSGSHLLLVTSGTARNETVIPNAFIFGSFVLPEWIYNKIYPVFLTSYLEARSDILIADDTSTQTIRIALKKDTDNKVLIVLFDANQTLTKDRAFRFQFDLLIDNASE